MLHAIKSLMGYHIGATDGEIGKVEDFYFDDETWTIRYLIVDTGNWLSGRKVLISPEALLKDSRESGLFPANLTREQVKNSPDIDTDKPVSRQHEAELTKYYPWQSYWGSGFFPGGVWGVINPTPVITPASVADRHLIEEVDLERASGEDLHLRSAQTVTGYHIHAADTDIGHVYDFIIDEQTWQIVCLVVNTHHWIGGRKVMIEVRHIQHVQWDQSTVSVDITADSIKNSPRFDESDYIGEGISQTEVNKMSHLDNL
jgi:uncharacterized protein YrrD